LTEDKLSTPATLALNAPHGFDNPGEGRILEDIHRAYLRGRVQSADPLALICMLYEHALKSVRTAREMLQAQDIAARSKAISKASDCIGMLIDSLDLDAGGEISRNLLALYGYMQNRLLEANLHQADEPLAEVQGLLTEMHGAWAQLADVDSPMSRPQLVAHPVS
jgi:flagellar protein FliS